VRVLEHGESVASIARNWAARGIRPVAAKQWWPTSIVGTLTSPRLAGLREWHGRTYPAAGWPAILDVDTHQRLVRLFADPARRRHVVRAPAHLLSGIATCPKCGRGLHYRRHASDRADSYGCVNEARRDYAGRVIDRADWLDIRQRTEDEIGAARRDYDRLAGSATVTGDIAPSERVRDAWDSWSTGRRRAAIRAVLVRVLIKPLPADANANVAGNSKNTALRRERELAVLRQRVEFDWRV